eukprot:605957-Prorocentrum_minimum.AAC.1
MSHRPPVLASKSDATKLAVVRGGPTGGCYGRVGGGVDGCRGVSVESLGNTVATNQGTVQTATPNGRRTPGGWFRPRQLSR